MGPKVQMYCHSLRVIYLAIMLLNIQMAGKSNQSQSPGMVASPKETNHLVVSLLQSAASILEGQQFIHMGIDIYLGYGFVFLPAELQPEPLSRYLWNI